MKLYDFTVHFLGCGFESAVASSANNALILACAERIKKGFHYKAYRVVNTETRAVTMYESSNDSVSDCSPFTFNVLKK